MEVNVDIVVGGGAGFFVLTPVTEDGREWMEHNIQAESWQFLGDSVAVDDGRYAAAIVQGAIDAGLAVQ